MFLCPYDAEDGEDEGTPTNAVRLDETMQEVGDELRYVYDYGDYWGLKLRLEKIFDAVEDSPVATCIGGRRAGPPENCGGLRTAEELAEVMEDPARFDAGETDEVLQALFTLG